MWGRMVLVPRRELASAVGLLSFVSRAVPASLSPQLQRKRARHRRVVDSSDDEAAASSADDFQ